MRSGTAIDDLMMQSPLLLVLGILFMVATIVHHEWRAKHPLKEKRRVCPVALAQAKRKREACNLINSFDLT